MRVLLTRSTGFVGSFTVPALLACGHDVSPIRWLAAEGHIPLFAR